MFIPQIRIKHIFPNRKVCDKSRTQRLTQMFVADMRRKAFFPDVFLSFQNSG